MVNDFIDTHTHLDGEEFRDDIELVIQRAREAGAQKLFVPGINLASIPAMQALCDKYLGFVYQMIGLHPEDVKEDWQDVLGQMYSMLKDTCETFDRQKDSASLLLYNTNHALPLGGGLGRGAGGLGRGTISIGEVGLDYYWSREYEKEQLLAFERQVEWSIETRLPLMIHCRKAQNEMVKLLRKYEKELPGGVFHCFTGNQHEALELMEFDRFVLGIGGVLTFKKSHLPEDLPASVPLDRIVLETDSPYMAPTPHRGERNEPSFVPHILHRLAEAYGVTDEEVSAVTMATTKRIFPLAFD